MKNNFEFPVVKVTIIAMLLVRTFLLTAQHSIIGTTDIHAYIQDAPGLPAATELAAKRAFGDNPLQPDQASMDRFYQPFEDKVNRRIKHYQDFILQKMKEGGGTEAAYMEQATAMVNNNPLIANMGGYEKVSQMSETEAKAAAIQATAQYTANPFAATGTQSAGMTALYQKVISDPAYAKKFEQMSDAEKEAELRKYMANDTPVAKTPAQMEQERRRSQAQQSLADRIRNAQEIQLKLAELQQQLSEVSLAFGQKLEDIEQQGRTHQAISEEVQKRYKAIPMVELGEYGHDHDPEQVRPLRIEEARLHRERAQAELKQHTVALTELADGYQVIVTAYLDFIKNNSAKIYGGTTPKDMLEGTNTEQPLVSFEAGLLGTALELCKYSRELTANAAQWEANYRQVIEEYR